jgi:hypothetical protein
MLNAALCQFFSARKLSKELRRLWSEVAGNDEKAVSHRVSNMKLAIVSS